MFKRIISIFTFLLLITIQSPKIVTAQTNDGPIYIVQSGDTLSSIAMRFNVSLEDLMDANNISNPNLLSAGQELVVPGLEGVSGILQTETIQFGDSYRSLIRRTQVREEMLRKLNRLVSPNELYVGTSLIVPQQPDEPQSTSRLTPATGETLLELAIRQGSDPWTLVHRNRLHGTWDALPGDVLFLQGDGQEKLSSGLPAVFESAVISPLPLKQGSTEVMRVRVPDGVIISGQLVGRPLRFFTDEDDSQVALQGVHALLAPGPYPLLLEATLPDGSVQSFEQMVLVTSGNYPHETIVVPPETIDQATSDVEFEQLLEQVSKITPQRLWSGIFQNPSVFPDCFTSQYGSRRTYIGQGTSLEYEGFHSGLDFCGGEGLQITAPADGKVVFAQQTIIRGNATLIDHGWGIFSGYWHQSEIQVQEGQTVKQGQVIGLVGGTGRVTGAHLHWEIWVSGVQVNPMDWLNNEYP